MWMLYLLVLALAGELASHNVFIYNPQVGHSHATFWGNIADILVEAGHKVTVYSPAYNENVNTTGTKLAETILRPRKVKLLLNLTQLASGFWSKNSIDVQEMRKMTRFMGENQNLFCQDQLNDAQLMGRLREGNYDVAISEVMSSCGFAIVQKLGIPAHVSGFATNLMEMVTTPFALENVPSYVPATMSQLSDSMNFAQRVYNFGAVVASRLLVQLFVYSKLFYEDAVPDFKLQQKIADSSHILANLDDFMEFPRPLDHRVTYLGGIAVHHRKPLDQEYETLLRKCRGPVIIVSFGSIVQSSQMPPNVKAAFIGMFQRFPEVLFIWKYEEEDEFAKNLTNVFKRKWIPQNDLFGHPKVKAHISHGGLNSITESAYAGVPMICIPLFGDQLRNAKMIEKLGAAYFMDKSQIAAESLTEAVKAVLYDPKYKAAATRISSMVGHKITSMQKRVVKAIENSVKFSRIGTAHLIQLRVPNFLKYYFVDSLFPFALLLVIISAVLIV